MLLNSNEQHLIGYVREVVYDSEHWRILLDKRAKGIRIMEKLRDCGITVAVLHGSVARGDVDADSDVDVSLMHPYPYGLVVMCLENAGFKVYSIRVVQATPKHTPKVYIYLDHAEEQCVSIPIVDMEPIEIEYYKFSGMVTLEDLYSGKRVCGVNKELMFIEPTEKGHREFPVVGNEGFVAKKLGISIGVVIDRVEALRKRSLEGHTGLFIDVEVPVFTEIESVVAKLCRENPLFRRRVAGYGLCT